MRDGEHVTKLPERNLDAMRAIAVLLVVLGHGVAASPLARSIPFDIWIPGRFGVLLFFVHTSLVLMSSLERQGHRVDWVWIFYVRRAFRIYPLAIVCILVVVGLAIPAGVGANGLTLHFAVVSLKTLVSNLLLAQNLTASPDVMGVLWSLPLEVQMYLLLPLCYLVARKRSWNMAVLVLLFMLAGYAVADAPVHGIWRLSVFIFGPCFCGGVVAYHILRRGFTPRIPAWAWIPTMCTIAVGFIATHPDAHRPFLGWLPCLALGLLIPQVRELRESVFTDVAHWVAKYSYGIYLVHVPLLWVWTVPFGNLPSPIRWISWIATTGALSVGLFFVVEQPMIRLGGRLANAPSRFPATVVSLP